MVTGKVIKRGVFRKQPSAAVWSLLLLVVIILGAGFQNSQAADETKPDWYRIRTNSVPISPEDITVDSTGAIWVTASNDTEYDPGVWRLPSGETNFEYLTNSRANNWLEGDYNHVVEKPNLDADVNYVVRDKAGNTWYALNNRNVLCEKADNSWLTFAMENTYDPFYGVDTTTVDSAHIIRLIDNQDATQDVLLVGNTNTKRVNSSFNVVDSRSEYISGGNDYVDDAYVDSHGRIWVVNGYGVQFGSTNLLGTTYLSYSDEYKDDPDIPPFGTPITGIMEDSLGNMWFINGSYGASGVYCLTNPDGTDDWIKYDLSTLVSASNTVYGLAKGTAGVMWFGPSYSGIVKYDPGTGWSKTTCASLGLPSEQILSMSEYGSKLWFTLYDNTTHAGVHALKLSDASVESWTFREDSTSLTSNRIKSIAADLSGGVWFASYDLPAVARMKADGTWVQYKEDTMDLTYERGSGSIPGMAVDSNNIVYMAPNRRAPIAYDINTEQWLDLPAGPPAPPADTYFYGLYVDPNDGKWFLGAEYVYFLNADNSAWTIFDTTDTTKFHDYRVQGALMDAEENMWFISTFVSGEVTLMKKNPAGGDPTWIQFEAGDDSGYLGGSWVYLDKNGTVWNQYSQTFDSTTDTWVTQADTSLFDTRPLHFLNGDIPANMDMTGALEPFTSTNQDLMTIDTSGNIYFCGGMVWLQSLNVGIVVRSPVLGDIDRDGKIELGDAILSMGSLAGMNSRIQSAPVDVTGDGKVDQAESLWVLQKIAGLR